MRKLFTSRWNCGASLFVATAVSIVVTTLATLSPATATPLAECDSGCPPLLPPVPILCRILVLPPILLPCPRPHQPAPPPPTSTPTGPAPGTPTASPAPVPVPTTALPRVPAPRNRATPPSP